jgi:DNA polymerase-3 subunit delta'
MYPWMNDAFAQIKAMKDNDKMPHALLITGDKKIGKQFFAKQVVQTFVEGDEIIEQLDQDNPNEMDEKELLIRRSNYQNLIYCHKELSKTGKLATKLRVDQIRKFCSTLEKTADSLQIGILYYADDMNVAANNSLLKTLEEPRDNTLIIILAHKIENVLITIRSRCSHIHIANSFSEESQQYLQQLNTQVDAKALLNLAYGVPFQAQEWLENDILPQHQRYQERWLKIALNPSEVKNLTVFKDNELNSLIYLQNLLISNLKELDEASPMVQIFAKANKKYIFYLLSDINKAIILFESQVNKTLLFNSIVIIWSHITHLQSYPNFFNQL